MSNYSLPPPLPTYHVLLEGEGLGQSLGNCKDDLLNVCMRHVEKMCKAELSRNFIERNHMENGKFPLVGGRQGRGGFLLGQFLLPGSGWHPTSWPLTVSSLPSHLRAFGQDSEVVPSSLKVAAQVMQLLQEASRGASQVLAREMHH